MRQAYFAQGGPIVVARRPVTGQVYDMDCVPGFVAHFVDGSVRAAVRCSGGNDAVVLGW
jgi:stage V sporulation protein SpoVS